MTLNEENYFSPEAEAIYMGSTQYKRFRSCEAGALAMLAGEMEEQSTTALLVGSYVDAYFSGTLALFQAKNPEIFKRDGTLKADYIYANKIIQRIESDSAFMAALGGEKQVIMTGTIEDVPVKIKVDSLLPDRIVDLKIVKDMEDVYDREERAWKPWWQSWGYDIQGAIYQEIVRQNTGKKLPFGLAVATKEKPEPDIALITIPDSVLEEALEIVQGDIAYYDGLKHGTAPVPPLRCGKCPYCLSTKVLTGFEEAVVC